MVELQISDAKSLLPSIVMQLTFETNLFVRLQGVKVILSSVSSEQSERLKAQQFRKWLQQNFLDDQDFLRKLRLHSRMNADAELTFEYNAQDYPTHPEFHFDEEFETKQALLQDKIDHFIGKVLQDETRAKTIEV